MSEVSDLLLEDARAALERVLKSRPQPDLALVFGYWIAPSSAKASEARAAATLAAGRCGAQQDFQTVAMLGYAIQSGLLDDSCIQSFKQGLGRVSGRKPFVDELPMSFCSDAIGLLGIMVGARVLKDGATTSKVAAWLGGFLDKIYQMDSTEEWQRCLFHATDYAFSPSLGLLPTISIDAADARIALRLKNILPLIEGGAAEHEEVCALKLIAANSAAPISYERAAIRLAALDWVTRSAPVAVPGRMTAQSILHLLERVPAGLRNWTWEKTPRTTRSLARQWHIEHEYHVQNLLWLLMAPIFPDLDDEQYLKKIGQKNPRADFYIPSMKLIVEAKFLRPNDKFQKVIDEVSSDTGLYGALGNDCSGIIPFIWDDSARCQEHDYLRQGLRKLPMVIDAAIIARPSNWTVDVDKPD